MRALARRDIDRLPLEIDKYDFGLKKARWARGADAERTRR
jgi:hypothetical protein